MTKALNGYPNTLKSADSSNVPIVPDVELPYPNIGIGALVFIDAVDMSYYSDTIAANTQFDVVKLRIIGCVLLRTKQGIAVAHQLQDDGTTVRHVSVIPWVCIEMITKLSAV